MKIVTVVGARPQFVKAAAVSSALRGTGWADEVLVHTGQHYDEAMSGSFFAELGIAPPRHNLHVGSGGHGAQTGLMMERLEAVVLQESPDCLLVYGDTNSTLAAALVASKLSIPVAHVEAGLRSFDRTMPEEINRVVTDHVSDLLFCPSAEAVRNLAAEGVTHGVHVVGDVMHDVLLREMATLGITNPVADALGCAAGTYVMATIHRPGNTDDPSRFEQILAAFAAIATEIGPVIWPAHPRTSGLLAGRTFPDGVHVVPPTTYRQTLALLRGARCALTDSGGLQKEAYWIGTPCVTVRPSTEWVETVEEGWNRLVDAERTAIVAAVSGAAPLPTAREAYGDGHASERIVSVLRDHFATQP